MDLIKSWLAAIGVYAIGAYLTAQITISAALAGRLETFGEQVVWLYIPQFLLYVLIAGAAAGAHTRPGRLSTGRHLLAALPVPLLLVVGSEVLGAVNGSYPSGIVWSSVATLAGMVTGWQVADLLWRTATRETTSYF